MMHFNITTNTRQGILHEVMGIPCQDACSSYQDENAACIVLCDGAGSVEHSEFISTAISSAMPQYLADHFEELLQMSDEVRKLTIVSLARSLVKEKAQCTFLAVAVNQCGKGMIIHIGDGMIFKVGEEAEILSHPENGADSTMTYFLGGRDFMEHTRIQILDVAENTSFLLCSDGVSGSLYHHENGYPAKAVSILSEWTAKYPRDKAEEKIDTELNELFRDQTNDDMSIAILNVLAD